MLLTFGVVIGIDEQVKIGSITQAALDDNFTFELKYRDTCAVELDSCGFFL